MKNCNCQPAGFSGFWDNIADFFNRPQRPTLIERQWRGDYSAPDYTVSQQRERDAYMIGLKKNQALEYARKRLSPRVYQAVLRFVRDPNIPFPAEFSVPNIVNYWVRNALATRREVPTRNSTSGFSALPIATRYQAAARRLEGGSPGQRARKFSGLNPARDSTNPRRISAHSGFGAFEPGLSDENFLGDLFGGGSQSPANVLSRSDVAEGAPVNVNQPPALSPTNRWDWLTNPLGDLVEGVVPAINERLRYEIQGNTGPVYGTPAAQPTGQAPGATVVQTGSPSQPADSGDGGKWAMGAVAAVGALVAAKAFNLI